MQYKNINIVANTKWKLCLFYPNNSNNSKKRNWNINIKQTLFKDSPLILRQQKLIFATKLLRILEGQVLGSPTLITSKIIVKYYSF